MEEGCSHIRHRILLVVLPSPEQTRSVCSTTTHDSPCDKSPTRVDLPSTMPLRRWSRDVAKPTSSSLQNWAWLRQGSLALGHLALRSKVKLYIPTPGRSCHTTTKHQSIIFYSSNTLAGLSDSLRELHGATNFQQSSPTFSSLEKIPSVSTIYRRHTRISLCNKSLSLNKFISTVAQWNYSNALTWRFTGAGCYAHHAEAFTVWEKEDLCL